MDYGRRLHGIDGLRLPVTRPWAGNVHWMYAVLLEDCFPWSRDVFRAKLAQRGVDTRDFFPSSASQPMVRKQGPAQGPFPIAEAIAARGVCLPSGLALTNEQLDFVCDAIDDIVR